MGIQNKNTDINARLARVERELLGPFLDVTFVINTQMNQPILSLNYTGPDYEVFGKALEIRNFYETAEEFYTNAKLLVFIDGIEQSKGDNLAIKWISPTELQINGNVYAGYKVHVKYSPLGRTKSHIPGPTEFFYIDEPASLPSNPPESVGIQSLAIGDGAQARTSQSINISGLITTKSMGAPGNIFVSPQLQGAGAIVTVTTPLINLMATGTTTITIPSESLFWVNSVSIVLIKYNLTVLTSQANISIGTSSNPTLIFGPANTTALTALHERQTIVNHLSTGLQNLQFTINTAAIGTGTQYLARVSYSGFVMEKEP